MWTPKRLVMMMVAFAGLLSGYAVYGHFLGGIDGLTPLPEEYWPPTGPPSAIPVVSTHRNQAEKNLKDAFGDDCDELRRINKLEIPSRHMVLAVDKFVPITEEDGDKEQLGEVLYKEHLGQVLLAPFSLAIFGKGGEINTIRSKQAFLKFDHPISSISEMGKAKIISAELKKDVLIVNNRRTADPSDDLFLHTEGPLFYEESKHLIYTNVLVRLQDTQSKPQPTNITAEGMDVFLTPPDAPPAGGRVAGAAVPNRHKPSPSSRKGQPETISGVDRITLRSKVQMDLYVDPRSGFMSANAGPTGSKPAPDRDPKGPNARPAPPAAKDHVQITTQGPFTYDVHKDFAVFEISHKQLNLPSRVHVTRTHLETGNRDELFCDRLELQFRHKDPPVGQIPGPDSDDRSVALEIDTADALQTQGDPVALVSYEEVFNASCHKLHYEARTKKTILSGDSGKSDKNMYAMKDGNMITAPELQMIASDQSNPQQAIAKGPGQIDMLDKTTNRRTLHSSWKDLLMSTKDGPYDCLILTGDAAFKDDGKDDEQGVQELRADRIKVWLEPANPGEATPVKPQPGPNPEPQQRMKPHHLEATNRVRLVSPEMNLKNADHFVIWFKDAPEVGLIAENPRWNPDEKPQAAPGAKLGSNLTSRGSDKDKPPVLTSTTAPMKNDQGGRAPAVQPSTSAPAKQKKPLNLEARDVKAHVLRTGAKNDLQSLECQGSVSVKQEPATLEDKGVDIRGDHLQLDHFLDGNILVVKGNPHKLAWVQLDKLTIQGKEVNIDQRANRSWVPDIGVMQILTATDFEGNKLAKPTQVTINWNKEMQFDGKTAFFSGGVTAEQNNSHLQCQEMQVVLDRAVSFKEGEKNGSSAKVERLVCDHRQSKEPVMVEDTKFEGSKLTGYQRLRSEELYMDNKESQMEAMGPGNLNLLQLGTADDDPLAPPVPQKAPQNKPPPKGKEELQLTRVLYGGKLHADNKQRIATFYSEQTDDVEVYHGPADDPDIPIDKARLPQGFLYLRCKVLKVKSEELANGQKNQKMLATGQVRIRSNDFWGDAQSVKFDEGSDWIILDGGDNMAHLYKVAVPGADPEKAEARKIKYNRKTKLYSIEDGVEIKGH